jgi:hypothetical protein
MARHTQVEILLSERIINLPFVSDALGGEKFHTNESEEQITNDGPETYDIYPLEAIGTKVPVAAVDCSNVQLGYGGGFSYEAARAAIVTKPITGDVHVTKIGPLVAKSPTNQGSILFALEAFAQGLAVDLVRDGIVLLDGVALPEDVSYHVPRRTKIVSLSKTVPPQDKEDKGFGFPGEPFVMIKRPFNSCLVRLSSGGFVLNGRVWSHQPDDIPSTFSSLSRSDALDFGYPDSLKLAHIFSKILPAEVLSARIVIMKKHGVRLLDPLDGRKLLLGSMWG